MTLPNERRRSIEVTRDFLRDLLDPKKTPRVPRAVRDRAYRCLRHYPWDLHLDKAARLAPELFGEWDSEYKKND